MEDKKEKENTNNMNKNKITEKHLNNLDEFIQKCLDNFKFVEPKQKLYESTGEDKNIIISHKSTIPDLVIWNKTFNKNKKFFKKEEKNKFSMNNIENNMNFINMEINLVTYLINLYLYKNGWIILTNENFSGPGTSINLYQYLQEKLKENCNLDNYIIIDINKQVKFKGYNFYNILTNVLNKILQKKQMELIQFGKIMSK